MTNNACLDEVKNHEVKSGNTNESAVLKCSSMDPRTRSQNTQDVWKQRSVEDNWYQVCPLFKQILILSATVFLFISSCSRIGCTCPPWNRPRSGRWSLWRSSWLRASFDDYDAAPPTTSTNLLASGKTDTFVQHEDKRAQRRRGKLMRRRRRSPWGCVWVRCIGRWRWSRRAAPASPGTSVRISADCSAPPTSCWSWGERAECARGMPTSKNTWRKVTIRTALTADQRGVHRVYNHLEDKIQDPGGKRMILITYVERGEQFVPFWKPFCFLSNDVTCKMI